LANVAREMAPKTPKAGKKERLMTSNRRGLEVLRRNPARATRRHRTAAALPAMSTTDSVFLAVPFPGCAL